MDYLDFDIEIGQGIGQTYPVRVLQSPAGEARETMHFPFDNRALDEVLSDFQDALLDPDGRYHQAPYLGFQSVQAFGEIIFEALLVGEVLSRYDVSIERAQTEQKGLRVRLRIEASELAAVPWEFLFDKRQSEYLSLSRRTPVVRYLQLSQVTQPLLVSPPLRVLGMIANPTDLPALDVEKERARVEQSLDKLRNRGLVELVWLEGQTWRDLQQAMRRRLWHIFHFVGHGTFDAVNGEGVVFLVDDEGRSQGLIASQLGRVLANHGSIRLAYLNSCQGAKASTRDIFSSTAATLVRRGVPAVVAMQYDVSDQAAIELSRTFYESLVEGYSVDEAIVEARVAVSLSGRRSAEWGIPVLYMRATRGELFHLQAGVGWQGSAVLTGMLSDKRIADRSAAMAEFSAFLDPGSKASIFLLQAPSGYGKSTVLDQYQSMCLGLGCYTARIDLAFSGIGPYAFLCQLCDEWGWENFAKFQAACDRFRQVLMTATRIEEEIASQGNREVSDRGFSWHPDQLRLLTSAWFEDFSEWYKDERPAVIFVDSYNPESGQVSGGQRTVSRELREWFEVAFLTKVKGKTNLRVVVAGQTVPNPNSQWEKWCLRHELGPIDDPNDWVHWALNNGIEVDQTNIDLICHLTDGHPLLTHTYLGKVPAWKVSHEQQAR